MTTEFNLVDTGKMEVGHIELHKSHCHSSIKMDTPYRDSGSGYVRWVSQSEIVRSHLARNYLGRS